MVKDTNADQTTDQGISFKQATGVTFREGQKLTGSLADFGEGEGNAVDFSLVTETKFTGELDFIV
jgi:hypothetical protein